MNTQIKHNIQKKNVTFQKAISCFLKGYLKFSGRATRGEFNYVIPLLVLWVLTSAFLGNFVLVNTGRLSQEELGGLYALGLEGTYTSINLVGVFIYFIWLLLTVPPFLSLWVRRGHDLGVDTPSSIATFFLPWVNIMSLLCYCMFDSDKGQNLYGDSEKYPSGINPKN